MTEDQRDELLAQLRRLREEHSELNEQVDELTRLGTGNQMQLTRLKKRKLQLKDAIQRVESRIIPNLHA
ncbi:MAG: YdcH family protein [Pseudomonadota bacterium]